MFKLDDFIPKYMIEYLEYPDYEKMPWDDYDADNYEGGYLVHNTSITNLGSILRYGIKPTDTGGYRSNDFTWAVNLSSCEKDGDSKALRDGWTGVGGTSVVFRVPKNVKVRKLNSTDFGIYDVIEPENIMCIDLCLIYERYGEMHRLSDFYKLFREYDKEEVREVYEPLISPNLSKESGKALMEWAFSQEGWN